MAAAGSLRKAIPWWLRVGAKIVLARLPVPYTVWKRLGLFEHGDMNRPQRALDIFLGHAETAGLLDTGSGPPRLSTADKDFAVLEIGPGDSLFSMVIAGSMGASRMWLIDAGPFAETGMAAYEGLFEFLRGRGFVLPFRESPHTLGDVFRDCGGEYLTEGVRSFARIPTASVDFCFSNAVLEHVPRSDFSLLATELLRILKPGGVSVHRVDLKDHLGGGLNNLRFSEASWEKPLVHTSGFYTNRIRFDEMMSLFQDAGFECRVPRIVRWNSLPLPRPRLAEPFRALPDSDLTVSGFDVVLRLKR